jgi:pimeloyl-ACP methyl ester carboxylesterase
MVLRGTYHRPYGLSTGSGLDLNEPSAIGVLLVNAGFLPRSGLGDSAVYWADSFAACGYPSFRIDLQGLGDSDGEPPADLSDFVNSGGFAPELAAIVKDIVRRFGLSGVAVVAHCASTVSAIFAAALIRECKGLALLDPYFHLSQGGSKLRAGLSDWAWRSRLGGSISTVYHWLKHVHLFLRWRKPPSNANLPLLRRWKQLGSSGLPILVMKAPALKARGSQPRLGEFDYLNYVQARSGRASRIVVKYIEGTNHSFADRLGRIAVRQHTERWLRSCFPLMERQASALNPPRSEHSGFKNHTENHEMRSHQSNTAR